MKAFLVCYDKECSLYHKSPEEEKCPKCGGALECSNITNLGHANLALCKSCRRYFNTMQDFKRCPECDSEKWFIGEKDLIE